jgi:hypothetical protein
MTRNVLSRVLGSGALVFLTLLVALVLAGSIVQPGVADDGEGNITIERTGNSLAVTVDEARSGEYETVQVRVRANGTQVWRDRLEPDSEGEFERTFNLSTDEMDGFQPRENLTDARVNVTLEDEGGDVVESAEKNLALSAISFVDEPLTLEDGTLAITADDIFGISDEQEVPLQLSGEGDVTVTVEPEEGNNGTWQLELSLSEVPEEVNLFKKFDLTAYPGEEAETTIGNVDLRDMADNAEITADAENGELTLDYDLVFEGGRYNITVAGADEGSLGVEVSEPGTLNLSSVRKTVLLSGNTTLEVSEDSDTVVSGVRIFDDGTVLELASTEADPPELSTGGGELRIAHELLFDGVSYVLEIETEGPEGLLTLSEDATEGNLTLPSDAFVALVADKVIISITHPSGVEIAENWTLDTVQAAKRTVNATLEGQQLNISSEVSWKGVERIWFKYNDTVTTLGDFDSSAGKVNTSTVEAAIDSSKNATMVLFDGNGVVVERLEVNITENSGPRTAGLSLFNIPEDGGVLFLTIWLGVVFLLTVVLAITYKARIPVVGEPGVYGVVVWLAGNALALSALLYFIEPRLEFGVGVVGGTSLVVTTFLLVRSKPQDLQALVIAALAGTVLTSLLLVFQGLSGQREIIGTVLGAGYGIFAGSTLALWDGKRREPTQQQSVGTTRTQPVDVTVTLVDAVTGNAVDSVSEVTAKQKNGIGTEPLSVNGGTATGSLQPGTWQFVAETGETRVTKRHRVRQQGGSIRMEVPGTEVTVQVQTAEGEPIQNADVAVESSSYNDTGSTGRQGSFTATLPTGVTTVDISAEHQLFEPSSQSLDASYEDTATLTLSPREGQLRVTASLGQDPVSGVSVTATRQGTPEVTVSGTTNDRGIVEFPNLLIGRYDLDVDLPVGSEAFTVAAGTAAVEEGRTDRQTVSIRFEYSLSQAHKRRVRKLRGELEDIAHSSRRDDAIQGYYASVLHAVLDEVERVPRSGHPFLEHNQEPDAVVTALLDATEEIAATMDSVLSSQRNVNLFSACSDLPGVNVDWRGNVDISILLRDATREVGQQRAEINTRLEQVDEQITSELRELAEVSPAREMWEGIRDVLRDQSGLDEIEVAASIFVALLVLDAIESVFERGELRKRLEQTVY